MQMFREVKMAKQLFLCFSATLLLVACTSLKMTPNVIPTVSLANTGYLTKTNTSTPHSTYTPLPRETIQSTMTPGYVTPEVSINPVNGWKSYNNNKFGLSVEFPMDWHGPDIYQWNDSVRIEVGSDTVYPYYTDRLNRVYNIKNSYYVVIQYSQNNKNLNFMQLIEKQPWIESYLSLLNLKDGETISGNRDMFIRVRQVKLGRFEGLEYIQTLSDTAQTEWFYARRIVLFDEQLNNLTIFGTPYNVEILDKNNFLAAYQKVDKANLDILYQILQLVSVE